jgi:hypothetical protein
MKLAGALIIYSRLMHDLRFGWGSSFDRHPSPTIMASWGKDLRDEFVVPLNSDIGATLVSQDDGVHHLKRSYNILM